MIRGEIPWFVSSVAAGVGEVVGLAVGLGVGATVGDAVGNLVGDIDTGLPVGLSGVVVPLNFTAPCFISHAQGQASIIPATSVT